MDRTVRAGGEKIWIDYTCWWEKTMHRTVPAGGEELWIELYQLEGKRYE
jgi:hypothetical protein